MNRYRDQKCSKLNNGIASARKRYGDIFLYKTIHTCIQCNKEFHPKRSIQKICNKECSDIFHKTNILKKENAIEHGRKGGIISAENQQRRSKAEIHFAELCIEYYGKDNVICNKRIFEARTG